MLCSWFRETWEFCIKWQGWNYVHMKITELACLVLTLRRRKWQGANVKLFNPFYSGHLTLINSFDIRHFHFETRWVCKTRFSLQTYANDMGHMLLFPFKNFNYPQREGINSGSFPPKRLARWCGETLTTAKKDQSRSKNIKMSNSIAHKQMLHCTKITCEVIKVTSSTTGDPLHVNRCCTAQR